MYSGVTSPPHRNEEFLEIFEIAVYALCCPFKKSYTVYSGVPAHPTEMKNSWKCIITHASGYE